jgi:CRISPR-associated protein Csm1
MSTLSRHNVGVDLQFGRGAITSWYGFSNLRRRLAVTRKAHDETPAASLLSGEALSNATRRVAFAGYLHDLGKLAERAGAFDDASDKWRANVHLYCPFHQEGGYHSHSHAAATALGLDAIELLLPPILHGDVAPFANRGSDGDPTDSFINAAAMRHKPDTFLQWCVATADRVASGFEREAFERYNRARDEHLTARLVTPFEEYGAKRAESVDALKWRYPLKPLTVRSLFPEAAASKANKADSVADYSALWRYLCEGLERIPSAYRDHWPLWLDAFDALWMSTTHAIPSAASFGVRPDVSLYDHSRAVAAFAAALWRYHVEQDHAPDDVAAAQRVRSDWDDQKLLLIQGDFSGVQTFIFGGSASTQEAGAKLLRGRSALVSLLCELSALKVLEGLSLPPSAQIINAAGKFLIVGPNTADVRAALARTKAELDQWFLRASFGVASVTVASEPASCNDFVGGQFAALRQRLSVGLDRAKRQRFSLASKDAPDAIRDADYSNGACEFDGRLTRRFRRRMEWPSLCQAQPRSDRARRLACAGDRTHPPHRACGRRPIRHGEGQASRQRLSRLSYRSGEPRGSTSGCAPRSRSLLAGRRRVGDDVCWIRAPGDQRLRSLVARKGSLRPRYKRLDDDIIVGDLKTFEHLAHDAQKLEPDGRIRGVAALGVLKGDNLGQIFATALGERATFANWAALSRRVSAFFSLVVPNLCAANPEFRDVYTVFAGGDDFYFIGPWLTIKQFATALRQGFTCYCAHNPNLHFSAAYLMVKLGNPMQTVTARIEDGLATRSGAAKVDVWRRMRSSLAPANP